MVVPGQPTEVALQVREVFVLAWERHRFAFGIPMVVQITLVAFDEGFDDIAGLGCAAFNAPQREPTNVFGALADRCRCEVFHFQGRYVCV